MVDNVSRLLFRNRRRGSDLSAPGLSIVPAVCSDQKNKSLLKEGCGQEEHSREEHSFPPFILPQVDFSAGLFSVCNQLPKVIRYL